MKFLDKVGAWVMDGNLALAGAMVLVAIFLACFFLKTFWGQWDNRYKKDDIYGNPKNRK